MMLSTRYGLKEPHEDRRQAKSNTSIFLSSSNESQAMWKQRVPNTNQLGATDVGCRPRKAHTQQPQKFPKLLKVEKLSVPSKFGLCADERPEGTLGSRPHFSKVAKISLTSEKGNWWKEVQYLQASSRLNKK
ncbi:uncharacterized protein CIMG_06757 [Coccidioides immitis RS]|uniref:Uncharacterized protein n=1 Tax=Coccidioides immitis (strain RS) TaxID=246410 RepID=J3K8U8_COCIM|nr:uncharacterized protein CIMG_06757 [Coccidioides immitis RS]EAS31278.3 hypothetical protein CIMG_06757 [Coccidioides immitis RS]